MIQTREILSGTAIGAGTTVSTVRAGGTFQVVVTGSGAVSATVEIQGSLYGGEWVNLGVIKLAGFDSATDGFVHMGSWCFYRANCTEISGTDALVTANMAGEV